MISYRDMTFCPFYATCENAEDCGRPLTPEVQAAAEKIGLPIARYCSKPSCHSDAEPAPRATAGDYADLAGG